MAEKSVAKALGAENPRPHFGAIVYSLCDPEQVMEPLEAPVFPFLKCGD